MRAKRKAIKWITTSTVQVTASTIAVSPDLYRDPRLSLYTIVYTSTTTIVEVRSTATTTLNDAPSRPSLDSSRGENSAICKCGRLPAAVAASAVGLIAAVAGPASAYADHKFGSGMGVTVQMIGTVCTSAVLAFRPRCRCGLRNSGNRR
jgi:hypothetical protein